MHGPKSFHQMIATIWQRQQRGNAQCKMFRHARINTSSRSMCVRVLFFHMKSLFSALLFKSINGTMDLTIWNLTRTCTSAVDCIRKHCISWNVILYIYIIPIFLLCSFSLSHSHSYSLFLFAFDDGELFDFVFNSVVFLRTFFVRLLNFSCFSLLRIFLFLFCIMYKISAKRIIIKMMMTMWWIKSDGKKSNAREIDRYKITLYPDHLKPKYRKNKKVSIIFVISFVRPMCDWMNIKLLL